MRAARLLQILLILQNRGRQTSQQLAAEMEVTPRTILRDVDAMTEAGLPIVVRQGKGGGIELGFNYRTRLTGLAKDEAQALGLILAAANPMIAALGLEAAARQARAKLIESLPDKTRGYCQEANEKFRIVGEQPSMDPRIRALAQAVQERTKVRLRFTSDTEQEIHPQALEIEAQICRVRDALTSSWIASRDWGRVNVSRRRFDESTS